MCSYKVADTEGQSHLKDWTEGTRQSRQLTSAWPLPQEAKALRHRGLGTKDQGACPVSETRWAPAGSSPTGSLHSLGHGQEHVGVVLAFLQGIDTLRLPLGPGLEEDGFRPQDT